MYKLVMLFSLISMSVFGSVPDQNSNVSEVGRQEVLRRGNYVEYIGGPISNTEYGDLLSPPVDDSYKWFITFITMNDCKYCDRLKFDFENAPPLQAWVNTKNPSLSFTHFNVYRIEDRQLQGWKFSNIAFKGVPTILIQPPLNGKYGKNSTVVAQLTGYDGNAQKLSDTIKTSIVNYVNTINRNAVPSPHDVLYEQRRPSPEFLPPSPNVLVPPELEGESVSGDDSFLEIQDGFKKIINGIKKLLVSINWTLIAALAAGYYFFVYKKQNVS